MILSRKAAFELLNHDWEAVSSTVTRIDYSRYTGIEERWEPSVSVWQTVSRLSICEPGQLWQIFNKDTNSRAHLHKVLDTRAFLARAFLSAMPRPFCGVRSGLGGADALAYVAMEHACRSYGAARCRRFRWNSPIKLFLVIVSSR